MAETKLDLEALVAALDAQREGKRISWRELARQSGVSPSTLTRMQQGRHPDVHTYSALLRWLGVPAENFMEVQGGARKKVEPNPLAVVSTLLRGKKKMAPKAAKALDELVKAAYRFAKELE